MNKVYGFEGEAKAKYGDMTYKLFADVFTACKSIPYHLPFDLPLLCCSRVLHPYTPGGRESRGNGYEGSMLIDPVPLAVLLSAGSDLSNPKSEGSGPAILSPEGKKRYFICHGGPPVSKDGVTLEEVAKIDRYVQSRFLDHTRERY
jgi:serine/threonine-protein phosphatase 5